MDRIEAEEKLIGEALVELGVMSQEHVNDILKKQEDGNDSLFGIMALESGYIEPEVLMEYLESKEKSI